jgi:hypothetical protein
MVSRGPPRSAEVLLPDDERRFTIELEFVQSLANPNYLHCKTLVPAAACIMSLLPPGG